MGFPSDRAQRQYQCAGVGYVAPSFTELLRQSLFFLDDELDHRDAFYEFDESPYQFAAEVLDWQRSTEAYLTEFGAVESYLDD